MIKDILLAQSRAKKLFDELETIISNGDLKEMFNYLTKTNNLSFLQENQLKTKYFEHLINKVNTTLNNPKFHLTGTQMEMRVVNEKDITYAYVHVKVKKSRILKTHLSEVKGNFSTRNFYETESQRRSLNRAELQEFERTKLFTENVDIESLLEKDKELYDYLIELNQLIGFKYESHLFDKAKEAQLVEYTSLLKYTNVEYQCAYVHENFYFLDKEYKSEEKAEFNYILLPNISDHPLYDKEMQGIHYYTNERNYLLNEQGLLTMIGEKSNVAEFLKEVNLVQYIV